MKNILKICAMGIMFSLVLGCATVAKGPAYSEAKAMEGKPNHAILYVYREYAEPTAWGATIHIDGAKVATLNQGGFTWFYAKPGSRKITAEWAGMSGQVDSEISLNISQNETYYVDLVGISRMGGVSGGTMYYSMGSGLNSVKPEIAEKRLNACCKFQKPVSTEY